jgi:uroporphyrin-III C-methyltransferase
MSPALLTAVDSSDHVHLIVGSNPLAAARCSRSLEVGAIPKLVAPAAPHVHYGIQKRVDAGEVEWIERSFRDDDLTTLGRSENGCVVDTVFVTLGSRNPQSKFSLWEMHSAF